jgi:hypothetical protein
MIQRIGFGTVCIACLFGGCAKPQPLTTTNAIEATRAEFRIWYPSEEGVKPGAIWLIDPGKVKQPMDHAPEVLKSAAKPASFFSISEYAGDSLLLRGGYTGPAPQTGVAGENLGMALSKAQVKKITLDWGKDATIRRLVTEDLKNASDTLTDSYRADYVKAQSAGTGYQVISGVVESSEFSCTIVSENQAALDAQFKNLVAAAGAEIKRVNGTTATWKVSSKDPQHPQVVAYAPMTVLPRLPVWTPIIRHKPNEGNNTIPVGKGKYRLIVNGRVAETPVNGGKKELVVDLPDGAAIGFNIEQGTMLRAIAITRSTFAPVDYRGPDNKGMQQAEEAEWQKLEE